MSNLSDALRRKAEFFSRVEGGHNETYALLKQAANRIEEQEHLLSCIELAWTDEGRSPRWHRRWQERLRYGWPMLYTAIRQVVVRRAE